MSDSELNRLMMKPDIKAEERKPPEEKIGPCASRINPRSGGRFRIYEAIQLASKNKPRKKTTRAFDYSHIGYCELDVGKTWFVIEVNEPDRWQIRADGIAVDKYFEVLMDEKFSWIAPLDYVMGNEQMAIPDGVPVLEQITIQRIEDD